MSSTEPRLPPGEGPVDVNAPPGTPLSNADLANRDLANAGLVPPPVAAGSTIPDAGALQKNSLDNIGSDNSGLVSPVASGDRSPDLASLDQVTPKVGSVGARSVALPASAHPAARHDGDDLPRLLSLSDLFIEAPPWLFSAALHLIAVIILGLIFVVPASTEALLLRFDYTDNPGDELSGVDLDVSLDLIDEEQDSALDPQQVQNFEDRPLVEATEVLQELPDQPLSPLTAPIQMALTGREKGMQQKLLVAYGGTGATQQAVMEGLRWLARYQGRQGLWSMRGRYRDGASNENHEAATGLALLAFQGAGYVPDSNSKEPFADVVSRAWRTLLKRQKEDGYFFDEGRGHARLYTHAICTIAVCELYGMTADSKYREPAQRAIDLLVNIQAPEGGWRYDPGIDSDLSVTGWVVMALQSARMAGLEVPTPTLSRVRDYLDAVSRESGVFYCYQQSKGATAAMTAEGLLCRQYLGWKHSDWRLQEGGDYLIRNLPLWDSQERDVYYWYYATQVCHHLEGKHWRTWNEAMRVVLPAHQVQDGSKERGSWSPDGDAWGASGGRLYVTCLSIYMLEVYYRHLPIYQLEKIHHGL